MLDHRAREISERRMDWPRAEKSSSGSSHAALERNLCRNQVAVRSRQDDPLRYLAESHARSAIRRVKPVRVKECVEIPLTGQDFAASQILDLQVAAVSHAGKDSTTDTGRFVMCHGRRLQSGPRLGSLANAVVTKKRSPQPLRRFVS